MLSIKVKGGGVMEDYAAQWLDLDGHRSLLDQGKDLLSLATPPLPTPTQQLPSPSLLSPSHHHLSQQTSSHNILAPKVLISPPLTLSPSAKPSPIRPISNTIKRRRRLNSQESTRLTSFFDRCPRPNAAQRQQLSLQLGLSPRAIQIWFQNRRAKVKRDQLDTTDGMLLFKPTIIPASVDDDELDAPVPCSSASSSSNIAIVEDSLDMLLGTEDWLGKALGLC